MGSQEAISQDYKMSETFQNFYDHYSRLPILGYLSQSINREIIKHPYRKIIFDILGKGITENHLILGKRVQRFVLSSIEIREELQKNGIFINKGLYYHLNLLVDYGVVEEIGILVINNRKVKFYCRTHKTFKLIEDIFRADLMVLRRQDTRNDLINLVGEISPNINQYQLTELVEKLANFVVNHGNDPLSDKFVTFDEWVDQFKILLESVTNVSEFTVHLATFYDLITLFDKEFIKNCLKLAELLKLHKK